MIDNEFSEEDEFGHIWDLGWQDSQTLHPGFGTYGGYVGQCNKCGIFFHNFINQLCSKKNVK